jgi:hypothetical protein
VPGFVISVVDVQIVRPTTAPLVDFKGAPNGGDGWLVAGSLGNAGNNDGFAHIVLSIC